MWTHKVQILQCGPVKCRRSLHCYWWSKEASRFWRTLQFMQIFKNENVDVPFFLPPKALNSCLGNMSKLCFCLVQEKSAERQCAHDFHWGKYFTTLYCIYCFFCIPHGRPRNGMNGRKDFCWNFQPLVNSIICYSKCSKKSVFSYFLAFFKKIKIFS